LTFTPRVNFTFFLADVTFGVAFDDKGNWGLLFTGAVGLSLSAGVTIGATMTDAPCIESLQGPGTAAGGALTIPPGISVEANKVWTGWPSQENNPGIYSGVDVGIGYGVGLPVTPQGFTGITGVVPLGKRK
jgi:hypothetical protein